MNHQLIQHFLHPEGLFQVVGLLACCALFVAHLDDTAPNGQEALPLTASNQRLLDPLIPEALIARWSPTLQAALPFGLFAAALLVLSAQGQRRFAAKFPLLALQVFIGLFFNNDLLLLVATQLPIVLPRKQALLWLVAQSLGMLLVWYFVLLQALGWLPDFGIALPVADSAAYPPNTAAQDLGILAAVHGLAGLVFWPRLHCHGGAAPARPSTSQSRTTEGNAADAGRKRACC